MASSDSNDGPSDLASTVRTRFAEIRALLAEKAQGIDVQPFIPTGLRVWDSNGGIQRSVLTVIGAATGEGKSIVKLQLARGAAKEFFKVLMIDFEDPAEKTADRALAGVSGIDSRLIGLLDLEELDEARLEASVKEIESWGSRVKHACGLKSTAETLKLMEESDADLILVDYAQAFPEDDDKTMERTIAAFAWEANALAQRRKCAIVVFSQVKADVEARGYEKLKRTQFKNPDSLDTSGFMPSGLNDISWAKTLGERAKCLMYLWRENRVAARLGANVKDNLLRVIIAKANFAREGDMTFEIDLPTSTLRDRGR
jgi:replicative DNA helicase